MSLQGSLGRQPSQRAQGRVGIARAAAYVRRRHRVTSSVRRGRSLPSCMAAEDPEGSHMTSDREQSSGPTSVCFVVTEVLGLVHNGGIATAVTNMALLLAGRGHRVEVLYCGHQRDLDAGWSTTYRDAGVTIASLVRTRNVSPPWVADSVHVYNRLRDAEFDVIIFQDWRGLGAVSALAKRSGLAFESSRLIHHVHGPTDWLLQANRTVELTPDDSAVALLERISAEHCDAVVGPSAHLLSWMTDQGWDLAADRLVIPYFIARHLDDITAPLRDDRPSTELAELVFFGRLEERKGVRVLAAALSRIEPLHLRGIVLTFLGRPAHFEPAEVLQMLGERTVSTLGDVKFLTTLDQPEACAYLRQPGRMAVIPSLLDNSPNVVYECIEDRVPFLASRAGGTGELVDSRDAATVLFDPTPTSLANALLPWLERRETPPPPRPAYDGGAMMAAWSDLLRPVVMTGPISDHDDRPVTVIIPHHDRPKELLEAVRSALAQDHPFVEVIVVDDGSESPAALAVVDSLAERFPGGKVRVLKQSNRYLGAARNAGAAAATTEWLVFLDDDDVLDRTFVRRLLTAQRATQATLISSGFRVCEVVDSVPTYRHDWIYLGSGVELASIFNTLGGAGMLVSKSELLDAGGFHEQHGVGHEDWCLYVTFALAGKRVASVPEPLYEYRVQANSMIRTTSPFDNSEVVNRVFRRALPTQLRHWPLLLRNYAETVASQQRHIDALHHELWSLRGANDHSQRLLDLVRIDSQRRAGGHRGH
jgi:O-antigen biosynthesis protein